MAISEFVRETVVGLLYGILLWSARGSSSSTSRRSRRPSPYGDEKGYGLNIALGPDGEKARNENKRILKSCMPARKSSPSFFTWLPSELSSLWTKSTTGDFLGAESGVHMVSAEDGGPWENTNTSTHNSRVKQEAKMWDIPPPLTLLQWQGEYTGPHPWFLKRECINGRLILKEVAVEYFEFLQATRADTDLVAEDNTANCCHTEEEDNGEAIETDTDEEEVSSETWNAMSWENDEDEEHSLLVSDDIRLSASLPETTVEIEMKNVITMRKCLTYTEGLASRMGQYSSQSSSPRPH